MSELGLVSELKAKEFCDASLNAGQSWASEESSLREESSISSRGQNMPRGGQSCAERREAARARDRQAAAASLDEADESDATEEEATGGRTTRVGRCFKVAAGDDSVD